MSVDPDKAYLLGLLIGGGVISDNNFQILLPYNKWGDIELNQIRAGEIATDILTRLNPIWQTAYGLNVSYKYGSDWKIVSDKISDQLIADLRSCGLPIKGELKSTANLKSLIPLLPTVEHKRNFIVGLIDTIGSLAKSHRRFVDEFQIISFEFKGSNFSLVDDVVRIFDLLGLVPDQVLWNHPNQHSGSCRYYASWKKGFKVRIPLREYMLKGGFLFQAKKLSAQENAKVINEKLLEKSKSNKIQGRVALHVDEYSDWLPPSVRGGHFVHNLHFNALFGLPSPKDFNIDQIVNNFHHYFCPFTVLTKGDGGYIDEIISKESYLSSTTYKDEGVSLSALIEKQERDPQSLVWGRTDNDGFPVNLILQAAVYSVLSDRGGDNIKGKRILGNYIDQAKNISSETIRIDVPNRGTCLRVEYKGHSALVGYINDEFNKKLIQSIVGAKVQIRSPDFDECVVL